MSVDRITAALHSDGIKMADPGSGGTITVRRNPCAVELVSAGAEARTLGRPTRSGVSLMVVAKTAAGTITLTVTGGYDEAGSTTLSFDSAGDYAFFVAGYDGTNYFWRLVSASMLGANTASSILVVDSGGFTSADDVEEALAEIYQHLKSTQVVVPIPLASLREVDANGDVGNSDANGGVLASNTTPILRSGTTESFELFWAASNVDVVSVGVTLPADLDDTADAYVDLYVQANTTDQAPWFTVGSSWQAGTQVTDAATAVTATTLQTITATIASGDIPAGVTFVTLQLTPDAHGTSAFQLHGARLRYKGKLRTS